MWPCWSAHHQAAGLHLHQSWVAVSLLLTHNVVFDTWWAVSSNEQRWVRHFLFIVSAPSHLSADSSVRGWECGVEQTVKCLNFILLWHLMINMWEKFTHNISQAEMLDNLRALCCSSIRYLCCLDQGKLATVGFYDIVELVAWLLSSSYLGHHVHYWSI